MHSESRPIDTALALEMRLMLASVRSRLLGVKAAPVRVGPYRLYKRIGQGSSSVVFEARDTRMDHRLALKVLRLGDDLDLALCKREFRVVSDLHHPNLVRLYELSIEDGLPLLAMDLVEGESVLQCLRPEGVLDRGRLQAALPQLVDAISALHAAGALHRDLKPDNARVRPDGQLVVLRATSRAGSGSDR
jgi:eukaryotic-like serine/threonine-protein kinase